MDLDADPERGDAQQASGATPVFCVEPSPAGGWFVRMDGHPAPVSRHDTEEEARAKADAYGRGMR